MKRYFAPIIMSLILNACGEDRTDTSDTKEVCSTSSIFHQPSNRSVGGFGSMSNMEKNILSKTNDKRRAAGKSNLKPVSFLNVIAYRHAYNMAKQNNMNHVLDGRGSADRATAEGYLWSGIAENIAAGYPSSTAVVEGWINSPGHRKNLLDENNKGYIHIGVGAYKDANDRWWYTQVFGKPRAGECFE